MPILLNKKHEIFSQRRALKGDSMLLAWKAAGYGHSKQTRRQQDESATKIANHRDVKIRVRELQGQMEAHNLAREELYSKDEVIEGLLKNAREASAAVEVLDRDGKGTGEFKANWGASNKAWELLGREFGMFAVIRKTQEIEDDPLENASDEALLEYLVTAAAKLGWRIDKDALSTALETRTPEGNGQENRSPEIPAGNAL
jgi:hypothetical protein